VGFGGTRRLATTLVVTIEDQGTHGARLRELPDHPARCVGEEEGSVGVRGVGVCGTGVRSCRRCYTARLRSPSASAVVVLLLVG
jgi:hypothetical protein